MWRLDVSMHVAGMKKLDLDMFSVTGRVREIVEREEIDAGAGFGFRDMGFEFDTKEDADAAAKRVAESELGEYAVTGVDEDPCADEAEIQ